jgi:prophage antirepressor-like protein
MSTPKSKKLAVFEGKPIRTTLHEGQWWFVITDVIAALTDYTRIDP